MKKIITLAAFAALAVNTMDSSDRIILKSGEIMDVYNIDIAGSMVYYTLKDNPDAPIYKIRKSEIFGIKLEGKEIQAVDGPVTGTDTTQGLLECIPAEDNGIHIDRYSQGDYRYGNKKASDSQTNHAIAFYRIAPNSIMSTGDVAFSIEWVSKKLRGMACRYITEYKILVQNKTDKTIYVDLSNTVRTDNVGNYYAFYDGTQVNVNNSSGGGVSLGLGGVASALGVGGAVGSLANAVTVGSGSSSGSTMSFNQQKILTIPPMGKIALPVHKYINGRDVGEKFENFSIEKAWSPISKKNDNVCKWRSRYYDYSNSPYSIKYMITYSFSPDFATYCQPYFTLYLSQLYGTFHFYNQDIWLDEIQGGLDVNTILGSVEMPD